MKICIYKIFFPTSNKYYIGQTVNLESRLIRHIGSKQLIGIALNKYDDWQVSILHICSLKEEADKLEIEEIKNYNSKVPNGYNLTNGGEGGDTFTNNPNKEDIRNKFKNRNYFFLIKRNKQYKNFQGKHHTKETIKKISQNNARAMLGKHHSKKFINKMKNNKYRLGKHHSEIAKLKMKISHLKRKIKKLENK